MKSALKGRRRAVVAAGVTAVVAAGGLAFTSIPAAADGVFQTVQVPLTAVGGAPGGGTVVDSHANGPVVFSHELYTLFGAVPGTYQVFVNLSPTSLDCTGPTFTIPTATFTTNVAGNGHADATYTPAEVAPFSGTTFSVSWTVIGPATYDTSCIVTVVD